MDRYLAVRPDANEESCPQRPLTEWATPPGCQRADRKGVLSKCLGRNTRKLSAEFLDALRAASKVVQDCAQEMREEND